MAVVLLLAALLTSGLIYQAIGSWRARRRFAPPGAFVDVGGHQLHVVCQGKGSPLVLLESGIAASSLSWTLVQPAIAELTRVCAYDRAGLAWSDAPSVPPSLTRIVAELRQLLDAVAPGSPVVLVGHSFGSFIVRAFAAAWPDRVAGLVLVDPAVEWLSLTGRRRRMIRGAAQLSKIGELLARLGVVRAALALLTGGAPGAPRRFVRIFGPTAARTLERLVGEVRKLPPGVHPLVQAMWCQPKCFSAMADYLRALERDAPAIAAITTPPEIPVIVISASGQPSEVLAAQRRLAEGTEAGKHIIAPSTGHWIQFDAPDVIVKAVLRLTGGSKK